MERNVDINTTCQKCIFAEWAGLTQIDCKLGRLDKFEDKGLITAHDDEETGEQFYKIDTYCNTCRDEEWANKQDDPIAAVKKAVQIRGSFIILENTDDSWSKVKDKTRKILRLIDESEIKPLSLVFTGSNNNINYKRWFQLIKDSLAGKNIKFDVSKPMYGKRLSNEELVHMVAKKCKHTYFSVFENGYDIPLDFLSTINKWINEDLRQISMIEPLFGVNGLTIQTILFNIVGGNDEKYTAVEKIKELAKEQEKKELIASWTQE